MTAAIQQAIFENNEGTKLVRHCHYDVAVRSFTSVLQILMPFAVIVEDKDNVKKNVDSNDNAAADASNTTPVAFRFDNKSRETDDIDTDTDTDIDIDIDIDTDTNDDSTGDNPPSSPPSRSRSRTSSSSSASSSTSTSDISTTTTTQSRTSSSRRKLQHFVFRDPVVIRPKSISDIDNISSPALFSRFIMIVMYNLALTLHLQAITVLSSSLSSNTHTNTNTNTKSTDRKRIVTKLFVRSKTLYELAYEMYLDNTVVDVDDTPLFYLALTNNLGLIYQTMNETNKCTVCFQNMFSTMMYVLDSSNTTYDVDHESIIVAQSMMKNGIWDGLLSNAMDILFQQMYEVTAAAA